MRLSFVLVLLLPSLAYAQPTAEQKKATVKWIMSLEDSNGGFHMAVQDPNIDAAPRPSLRATSAAVRALKYLNADLPRNKTHMEFVLKCIDGRTGGFADQPGGQADVTTTSVGVMAAMELGIPKEKFGKAMDYLKENAKTFEDVRIGAAAVEAWGVKDCPFKLDEWYEIGKTYMKQDMKFTPEASQDGEARLIGSASALYLRLEKKVDPKFVTDYLNSGQRDDGAWGKKGEKASDIETTYRVMRALMLLKEKPKDVKKLREFIESHRNKDGGYATKPGDKSSMSGVYYCVVVSKWLDEMEKK